MDNADKRLLERLLRYYGVRGILKEVIDFLSRKVTNISDYEGLYMLKSRRIVGHRQWVAAVQRDVQTLQSCLDRYSS